MSYKVLVIIRKCIEKIHVDVMYIQFSCEIWTDVKRKFFPKFFHNVHSPTLVTVSNSHFSCLSSNENAERGPCARIQQIFCKGRQSECLFLKKQRVSAQEKLLRFGVEKGDVALLVVAEASEVHGRCRGICTE